MTTAPQRIVAALSTIQYALDHGAAVILMSHLGRPDGERKPKFGLKPIAEKLQELLKRPVKFLDDCVGPAVETACAAAKPGDVILLENLRFHAEEENNDEKFSRQLASLAEFYVNDAFGAAHRAHASTVGITKFIPKSAAGLLMEKEWAEYLTLGLTVAFLPWELYELARHPDWFRLGLLLINLAVLWYLVWLLRRKKLLS